jgi:hypothetical protein
VTRTRFEERQHFRQWWIWLIILLTAAIGWWGWVQQIVLGEPFGSNPGPDWLVWLLWLFIGLGLPALFLWAQLRVTVTDEDVIIRYVPFTSRRIALREILGATAREYDAVREYGGWGVKGWSRDKRAYNVSGNEGVELFLRDGRTIMIGSRRAAELEQAIMDARDALP